MKYYIKKLKIVFMFLKPSIIVLFFIGCVFISNYLLSVPIN